jgi:hypothetical protein
MPSHIKFPMTNKSDYVFVPAVPPPSCPSFVEEVSPILGDIFLNV